MGLNRLIAGGYLEFVRRQSWYGIFILNPHYSRYEASQKQDKTIFDKPFSDDAILKEGNGEIGFEAFLETEHPQHKIHLELWKQMREYSLSHFNERPAIHRTIVTTAITAILPVRISWYVLTSWISTKMLPGGNDIVQRQWHFTCWDLGPHHESSKWGGSNRKYIR